MAVIRSTQNPFTFKPTGNATVKPIFRRVSPPPPANVCYSYKIQSTEAGLTQYGNGIINTTVNVRYTACNGQIQTTVVNLVRTGIPVGNSIEYAAYLCSTTKPEVFNSLISVSSPDTNTNLCTQPIEIQTRLTTEVSPLGSGTVSVFGSILSTSGRIVTATATPSVGFRFSRWSITKDGQLLPQQVTSPTIDFVMDADITARAIFEAIPTPTPTITPTKFTIRLTTNDASGGTIGFTTPQAAVGLTTFSDGIVGERIEFTARENSGYEFDGWYLNGVQWSDNRTAAILFSQDVTFEARFVRIIVDDPLRCTCYFIAPTDGAPSYQVRYRRCDTGEVVTETFTTFRNICSANIPEAVSNAQPPQNLGTDCSSNINICGSPPTPTTCITPTGTLTRTVDVECAQINNNTYVGGTAKQTQVREIDFSSPPGTICEFTEWRNSGQPDTTLCILREVPQTCTPPSGPFTQVMDVPCSQIDSKFTSGTAQQTQIRRYDASAAGPGTCPYTSWENTGTPNTATCVQPVFWRNCVTGQLVEGVPPTGTREVNYSSGGTCWEPITEVTFTPTLNNALRYSYTRGSSVYPTAKSITVTNASFGLAYRITLTTNSNITLNHRSQSGKGSISFIVGPRSTETFSVNLTSQLLQELQDGVSSLSMNVEYQQV